MMDALLSKRNTLVLKGGGILMMLFHHLFYSEWSRPLYNDITIQGTGLVNQLGIFCKICVSVFVFASGYGLMVSTPKEFKLKDFYWHRFKKLYLNYWFIWLLFVPISVVVFGRTFTDAYGDHIVGKAVLDFFGLLKMFGYDSYNPTWWFYNCIIFLYLLFPLLKKWLLKSPYLVIAVAASFGVFSFIPGVNVISGYLLVFISGMLLTKMPLKWTEGTKWWHIVIALLIISAWRLIRTCPRNIVESLMLIGMVFFLYKVHIWDWLRRILEELGTHSMNIFLIHTFIFYLWFPEYIYTTHNPFLIFFSLVFSSYIFSLAIEWLKRTIGFYKI